MIMVWKLNLGRSATQRQESNKLYNFIDPASGFASKFYGPKLEMVRIRLRGESLATELRNGLGHVVYFEDYAASVQL